MKRLKLFEDFETTKSILQNTEDILLSLRDFGFDVKVNSDSKRILIEISKVRGDEFKVFYATDISSIIEESDSYLSLGEGLKLETIHLETIQGGKELQTINSLKRERSGILSIFISYLV